MVVKLARDLTRVLNPQKVDEVSGNLRLFQGNIGW